MARPIRDEPTRTAGVGDPMRAATRFGEGQDWIDHGTTALARAGESIANVIAERVSRQNDLADAITATRAKADISVRVQDRIRSLDPRSPTYTQDVSRIVDGETASVLSGVSFARSSARQQFEADMVGVRGQLTISAMSRRERALVDDAKLQAGQVINQAVAAVSAGVSPGQAMLRLEAELAPILAAIDPAARDRVLFEARSALAGEAVKALVDRRDFAGAEAMLRNYGEQKLLSPSDIRAIRSGIEKEKRQAAAEAALQRRMAEADLRDAIATATTADEARAILDDAIRRGVMRPGSPLAQTLRRRIEVGVAREHTAMVQTILDAEDRLSRGDRLTEDQEVMFFRAAERLAADEAARRLKEAGETDEAKIAEARTAAQLAERERLVSLMFKTDPHRVPTVVAGAARRVFPSASDEAKVNFLTNVFQRAGFAPGNIPDAFRKMVSDLDPRFGSILEQLNEEGLPVTASALAAAALEWGPLASEQREARRSEWQRLTGGSKPSLNAEELLNSAFKRELRLRGETAQISGAVRTQALRHMSRAFEFGRDPEQAATEAARYVLNRFVPNPLAPEHREWAAYNPALAIPPDLNSFGRPHVYEAVRGHLLSKLAENLVPLNETRKRDGLPELALQDIDVRPVAAYEGGRVVGIQLLVRAKRDPGASWYLVPNAETGQPWTYRTVGKTMEQLREELGLVDDIRQRTPRGGSPDSVPSFGMFP